MKLKDVLLAIVAVLVAFLLLYVVPRPARGDALDTAEKIGPNLYTQCHGTTRIYMYISSYAGNLAVVPGGCP